MEKNQGQIYKVNPKDLDIALCSDCDEQLFTQVFKIRHAGPIVSPTGKPHDFLVPAGFACASCGAINKIKLVDSEDFEEEGE